MNRFKLDNQGFTLIELMIVLALLLIVLTLGFTLFFFGTRSFETGTTQSHLQQNARIVDEYLKRELRNVGRITVTNDGSHGVHYLGSFKIDEEGYLLHNEEKVTEAVILDITVSKEVDSSSGETFIVYEITTRDEQNFYVKTKLLLNNLISPDAFNTGKDSKPSLKDYVLYYYLPGDPLPEGHAFIDLNGNRIYDRLVDIPIPNEELTSQFDTLGYTSDYTQYSGMTGTGGSLIIPSSLGTIIIDSLEALNWNACEDIIIGVDIYSEAFNDLNLKTRDGDIEFISDTTLTVKSSMGNKIQFQSGGKIRAQYLTVDDLNSNIDEIIIFSDDNILMQGVIINSAADVSIISEKGDIFASSITLFQGNDNSIGDIVIETGTNIQGNKVNDGGKIVLNNAIVKANSITSASRKTFEANEASLEITNSTNSIDIYANDDIYLHGANIVGAGGNNTVVNIISENSSIYATLLRIDQVGPVVVIANNDIIFDGSQFDVSGAIEITSDNISASTYEDGITLEETIANIRSNTSIVFRIVESGFRIGERIILYIDETYLESNSITAYGIFEDEASQLSLNQLHLTTISNPDEMTIFYIKEENVIGTPKNGVLVFEPE